MSIPWPSITVNLRTMTPDGRAGGLPPVRQRSRRRRPLTCKCVPPVVKHKISPTLKRKETCAGKEEEKGAKQALEPYRWTSVFAGRTRKSKETCADKARVLAEAKRRRKGHQTLN